MDTGEDGSDDEGDGSFWTALRFIGAVLGPCFKLMRKTDSSAPFMGKYYKCMSELGGELDDLFSGDSPWNKEPWSDYQQEISEAHSHRWEYSHCDYHAAGFALDPNFIAEDVNGVNGGEVFQGLVRVIERHYLDDEVSQEEALRQYQDFRKQRGVFSAENISKVAARAVSAHEWWEMVAGGAPELRRVAMKVLSKTTSASACERNWSAFGAVQTPKRNRLSSKTLNDLVFVRVNLRLQQKQNDPNYKALVAEWVDADAMAAESDNDDEAANDINIDADVEADVAEEVVVVAD